MRSVKSAWICSTSLPLGKPSNDLPISRFPRENFLVASMYKQEPGLPETTSSISSCFVADLVSSKHAFRLLAQDFLCVCKLLETLGW